MIDRRTFLTLVLAPAVRPLAAQGPPAGRMAAIGILSLRHPSAPSPLNDALMQGLREHGYLQGRTLDIEFPDAGGREERLPELAAELVRKRVDVILVIGPAPLAAARQVTSTIPIVMVASSSDPVAEGYAASLARPGGNVTGLTYAEPDRFKKQLELLKAVAGRVGRVAVLWDFDVTIFRREWEAPLAQAAQILGMAMQEPVRVRNVDELPAAFARMKQREADALIVASGAFLLASRARVAELAIQHRLPAIAAFRQFPEAGLLMSYGPDLPDINRRAAAYVDKILKGAKPGELPIELPNRFELAINRKTATTLGIVVAQSLLMRADVVID